jgi:hypothetical protein
LVIDGYGLSHGTATDNVTRPMFELPAGAGDHGNNFVDAEEASLSL